jgi:hypothetical protein
MLLSKFTLLLLGTIVGVSYAAVYPSLKISNNFAVTGTYGISILEKDANDNITPRIAPNSMYGFKGKALINLQVSDDSNALSL